MEMISNIRSVVIDPSSGHYLDNKLFDLADPVLNRDGSLLPFHRVYSSLKDRGVLVNTADLLLQGRAGETNNQYFSLGMLANLPALKIRRDVEFKGFLIMEPPIVAPELYRALPELTELFDAVYVHNTIGDGYSLAGVNQSKLRKLFWPQPYLGVIEKYWSNVNRQNRIVVINGNHKPRMRNGELYSKRIQAMAALATVGAVDLYGRGWNRWWARSSLWLPYWLNRRRLMSIYRGACQSKYEVLGQYRYCLCFENMSMTGYVTEKIFDCLYAGTIPLYWGAPDIDSLIPAEAYIDVRQFASWTEMWEAVNRMTEAEVNVMRDAGRKFLSSNDFLKYYNSLQDVVDKNVGLDRRPSAK
jgi:hypothetical protein